MFSRRLQVFAKRVFQGGGGCCFLHFGHGAATLIIIFPFPHFLSKERPTFRFPKHFVQELVIGALYFCHQSRRVKTATFKSAAALWVAKLVRNDAGVANGLVIAFMRVAIYP